MTDRLPALMRRYRSLKAVQPGPNQTRTLLTATLFAGTAGRLFRRLRRTGNWYRLPRPDGFCQSREVSAETNTENKG